MHVYNSHDAYIYIPCKYIRKQCTHGISWVACGLVSWEGIGSLVGIVGRLVGEGVAGTSAWMCMGMCAVLTSLLPFSLYIYMYHTYIYIYACAFFYKGYMFEKQTYNMWNNLGSPKLTALSSLRCLAAFHCGRGRIFLHQLLGVLGWLTYVWIVGSILCIHHQVIKRGN